MIVKTTGTVLRYWPYKNSSRIVSWLTPDYGRISTLIRGSQRPRSFFLGQYDLFYTCELLFYIRGNSSLYTAKECYPLNARTFLRSDYQATALASYYADLIYKFAPANQENQEIFAFLNQQLDHLSSSPTKLSYLFWFELKLLDVLGLTPVLDECLLCSARVYPTKGPNYFSNSLGGICCAKCRVEHQTPSDLINPDVFATLLSWQGSNSFQRLRNTYLTSRQIHQLQQVLESFMLHHLDTSLESRPLALGIIQSREAGHAVV